MGKYINPAVLDLALGDIRSSCNKMVVCSQQPLTFAEANATYALASVAMAPADFTLANGDTSGRKVSVAAKAAVPVTVNGTGNHVALVDTATSTLKLVTTAPSTALSAGGTVDIGAWKDEIQAPA